MLFFNSSYCSEFKSKLCKAFFISIFCHALVHISPLVVLTISCRLKIVLSRTNTT